MGDLAKVGRAPRVAEEVGLGEVLLPDTAGTVLAADVSLSEIGRIEPGAATRCRRPHGQLLASRRASFSPL